MTAVERVAAWVDNQGKTLLLNDDGRLLQKDSPRHKFRLVERSCSGTQALMYAYKHGFELVGTQPPTDFEAPALPEPERNKTMATKVSKQDQYFAFVNNLLENDPDMSAKAAFEAASKEYGVTAGNISTAYYRMKRQEGGNTATPAARRSSYQQHRRAVPDELQNIMPTLRSGLDAFERIIAWADARAKELDEREASIMSREQEAKDRIQKQLSDLFS